MKSYTSLNDAAKHVPSLAEGSVTIWYWKPEISRDAMMGYDWLLKQGLKPDKGTIEMNYVNLGSIMESDLNLIYCNMQGEVWSPLGEARELIKSKGLSHTSMSVGDVVEKDGKFFMVDSIGFVEIK